MFHFSYHFSLTLHRLHISLAGGSRHKSKTPFFLCAEQEAKHCEEAHQFSTAKNYRTAIRSLHYFLQQQELMVQDLSPELMAAYSQWLRQHGISMNTVSCYLRSLRAIYNKVVKQYRLEDRKPFNDLFTGHAKTVKRAATDDDIKRLQTMILLKQSALQLSRDIFSFQSLRPRHAIRGYRFSAQGTDTGWHDHL